MDESVKADTSDTTLRARCASSASFEAGVATLRKREQKLKLKDADDDKGDDKGDDEAELTTPPPTEVLATLLQFVEESRVPEELLPALAAAGGCSLAMLAHALAGEAREQPWQLSQLKLAGVPQLGNRIRVCNALSKLSASARLPRLVDVVPERMSMIALPKGFGAEKDLSHLVTGIRKQSANARRSFAFAQQSMSYITQVAVHSLAPDPPLMPTPLPRSPPSKRDPHLVLFIACHCVNDLRLTLLRRCLKSVAAQAGGRQVGGSPTDGNATDDASDDWPLAGVFISWSAEASVRDSVRAEFDQCGILGLHAFEREGAHTQLQHLATLLPEARRVLGVSDGAAKPEADGECHEIWVMFTDDDDLLHPARCATYKAAILASKPEVHAVAASWVARPMADEPGVTSAADVEVLLAAKRVVRTPKEGSEKQGGGGSWDEFWNAGMRLRTFQAFFDDVLSPRGRTCKYADIALFYYLRNSVPTARFEPHRLGFNAHWMHYYDKPMQLSDSTRTGTGAASAGTSITESDLSRAAQMEQIIRDMQKQLESERAQGRSKPETEAMATAFQSFLSAHDEKVLHGKLYPHQAQTTAYTRADGTPSDPVVVTPVLLLASQTRSIIELFCVNFVGAPCMPSDADLRELARTIVVDTLAALGASVQVAAVLQIFTFEPMLKDVLRMFGLPAGSTLNDAVTSMSPKP